MERGIYRRLAVTNLKNNRKTYIPYIMTAVITVMMFYMIHALTGSISEIEDSVKALLQITYGIVAVFAVIFLFYTNSFLMKRRKKEIGVYHILGMEKKHISKVLGLETMITAVISLLGGMALGMILGKLFYLIFMRILHQEQKIYFSVDVTSIIYTVILFSAIFFLTYLYDVAQIFKANTIELLRGSRESEKEPRTKWLLVIIGVITLGMGYFIALTTKKPLEAFTRFFIAVLCVIVGTYALFTAGSILILKLLRKNRKYYYQAKHFTSVSGMIYRMKQNAVGLANICILSTMVLILVSVSVSMYAGMEDIMRNRFPWEVKVTIPGNTPDGEESLNRLLQEAAKEGGAEIESKICYRTSYILGSIQGNEVFPGDVGNDGEDMIYLYFLTAADYNRMEGQDIALEDDQILLYCTDRTLGRSEFSLGTHTFQVVQELSDMRIEAKSSQKAYRNLYVVLADDEMVSEVLKDLTDMEAVREIIMEENIQNTLSGEIIMSVNLEGSQSARCRTEEILKEKMINDLDRYVEGKEISRDSFYQMYGSLLFIGIYLGIIFIMATVLIIYYKQISEGYDDRERYQIMQKVGMSKHEVRSTIRSQVLTVFYLPLAMAFLHSAVAFPIVVKLLALLNLTNVQLFLVCILVVAVVFAIFYTIVYLLTAREYYRIVN